MKQKLAPRFLVKTLSPLLVLGACSHLSYAQTVRTWDGGGTPNNNMDVPANWSGDIVPNGANSEIAQWDGTVSGPLSLNYTAVGNGTGGNLGASPALSLSVLGTQTEPLTINEASGTAGIRIKDLTVASGAGAVTFGGIAGADNLNLGSTNVKDHAFTNNSANPVTFATDVVFGAGNAVTHNLTLTGSGNWNVNASLERGGMGAINVIKDGSGKLNLGQAKSAGTAIFTITSGTIENTSGSAMTTLATNVVLNGDFTFNGAASAANDLSFGAVAVSLGAGAGTSRAITTTGAALLRISGVIADGTSGNGIVKSGPGGLRLDGANTFTGGVTLNSGLLHLGVNGALGSGPFTINGGVLLSRDTGRNIGNSTTISGDFTLGVTNINNQFTISGPVNLAGGSRSINVIDLIGPVNAPIVNDAIFSGVVSNGGITKTGPGTLLLSGANTFSGATTVNGGKLVLNSTSNPPITLTDGILDATGTVGAVNVGAANPVTLSQGNGGTATLTTGNLSFAGAATVNVNLPPAGPAIIAQTLTTSGTDDAIALRIKKTGYWTAGLQNLISYTSFPSADINDFAAEVVDSASLPNRHSFGDLVINGNNIALPVTGTSIYWTGLAGNLWAYDDSESWKETIGNATTFFQDNDAVVFNDAPTTDQTIEIADPLKPNTTIFNNSARNYTFNSPGNFGIETGLVEKNGTGTVTINTNNTYTGGTTLNAGRINVNNAGALGLFDTVSGNGGLVINGGTLGNTSGGPVAVVYNYTQVWNSDFTFAGADNLDLGTGAVTSRGTGDRTVTVSSNTLAVGELKTAANQGFVKQGAGTLALTSLGDGGAASVVNGALNVAAGTLQINRTGALGNTATGDLTVNSLTGSGSITNGSDHERWLRVIGADATTFAGTLANGGTGKLGLEKLGSGTLTLSGNNSFSGEMPVRNGTLSITGTNSLGGIVGLYGSTADPAILNLQNSNALGTSVVSATNRTSSIQLQGGITLPPTVTFVTSGDGSVAGTPTVFNNLGGDNTIQGSISLGTGGGNTAFHVDNGSLKVTGNITIAAGQSSRGINLQGESTGDNVFSGVLSNLSPTSITSITKNGGGTWTVSGTNTYTGATTVNAGKLIISGNNAAATGSVTVKADATLAGNGNLGGSVTVESGGILSLEVAATPGAQVTRNIGGFLTNNAGSVLNLTTNGTPEEGVYTLVTATGTVTLPTTITGFTGGVLSISGNSLILTVGAGGGSAYDSWATSKGLTGANNGATQDPDFDGISNILEFTLDGNPLSSDTGKLPVSTQDATNFYFDFNRRNDSVTEAALTFEYGTNLASWPSSVAIPAAATPVTGPPVTITDNGDGTHHVKVTVPKAGNTTLFGRLKAVK